MSRRGRARGGERVESIVDDRIRHRVKWAGPQACRKAVQASKPAVM
jgi:hypothetical protein